MAFAACGVTGYALADLMVEPGQGGTIMSRLLGRTISERRCRPHGRPDRHEPGGHVLHQASPGFQRAVSFLNSRTWPNAVSTSSYIAAAG